MKVLVIHNRYRSAHPSGENNAVEDEIALLEEAGCEVILYYRESDDIRSSSALQKVALAGRITWSIQDQHAVKKLIASNAIDVVHVHNTFPLISPAVVRTCARRHVPVVATLHNYRLMCVNGLLYRAGESCEKCVGRTVWAGVRHACYRQSHVASLPIAISIQAHRTLRTWADGVACFIALSAFARSKFISCGVPATKIEVLSNAVSRPSILREGPGDYFLYMGRLSPEKGVDLLADAWHSDLGRLIVVGDGPSRASLQRRFSTGDGSVTFLGSQPREECIRLLHDARALVASSRVYEGSPVAVAEAYASGVPVIAPALGGFGEYVEDGRTGALFTPGSTAELHDKLRDLCDNGVAIRMGDAARGLYERLFAPESHCNALLALYERAIDETVRLQQFEKKL